MKGRSCADFKKSWNKESATGLPASVVADVSSTAIFTIDIINGLKIRDHFILVNLEYEKKFANELFDHKERNKG